MSEENVIVSFMKKFDQYPFCMKINGKEYMIGEGKPEFTVNLKKNIPLNALLTSTSLALGEAYMDGDLEIEGDLYYALDHFLGQMDKFSTDESALKKLIFTSTAKKNQKKEVQSHYDIGNDFYKLWLDDTMSYSCGYFLHEDDTLTQAQINKVDYILKKLYLKEGMSLLDIGCGWGFLLIEAEHLEDLLTVELMDYRDLPKYGKTYDRVVSVGMVEHVGRDNYRLFMDCVKEMLPARRRSTTASSTFIRSCSPKGSTTSCPW